ncbi:MAG: oligopeptide transport system substrate-binding protein [Myxococcota bacterium]|jgi:oligopeptide transport system substrate-binding protein
MKHLGHALLLVCSVALLLSTVASCSKTVPFRLDTPPPLDHVHGTDAYPCTGGELCYAPSPSDGTLYTVSVGADSIDPGRVADSEGMFIVQNIFEGLTKPGVSGTPTPGVAESWRTSSDGLTWTFALREDAKWSNGRAVTAHDFVYSILRRMGPEMASSESESVREFIKNGPQWAAGVITDPASVGVRAQDDHTLVLTLSRRNPLVPNYLMRGEYYPVAREVVEAHGERWTDSANIVSNGAYSLQARKARGDTILVKNPWYHGADRVRISKVHIYDVESRAMALRLYNDGRIQWLRVGMPADELRRFLDDKRPDVIIDPVQCFYYYGFHVDRAPFDDLRVRRAFNMAIDKAALVAQVLGEFQSPAQSPVSPWIAKLTAYPRPQGQVHDVSRARQLLAEAGFPDGENFPSVELIYNTYYVHKRLAEAVKVQLKRHLNIEVTVTNVAWKTALKLARAGDFQMMRGGWCGGLSDPVSFLRFLRSRGPNNGFGYRNPRYDAIIDASYDEADPAARQRLLSQAEELIIRDVPIAPVYYYTRASLKLPVLRGYEVDLSEAHLLQYMYWGDQTPGRD